MWDKIELLIDAKGLKWADLAQLIGVKDSRISKWRSGTGEVDRKQVLRIAKVLETGVEYLADDSLEDPRAAQRLTEDEAAVVRFYRSKKAKGELDEDDAIAGMAGMAKARPVDPFAAPVVVTGQAAIDVIEASGPYLEAPVVYKEPPKGSKPSRKKA